MIVVVLAWVNPPSRICASRSQALLVLKFYEVKGKVLLADGKPLGDGSIYFVPKGDSTATPSRRIATDGSFSIVTGRS